MANDFARREGAFFARGILIAEALFVLGIVRKLVVKYAKNRTRAKVKEKFMVVGGSRAGGFVLRIKAMERSGMS